MRITILFLIALLLSSCYSENEEELFPEVPVDPEVKVSFVAEIKPLFDGNCNNSCHRPGFQGTGTLVNYEEISGIANNGKLVTRAITLTAGESNHMPPNGRNDLSQNQETIIQAWVDQGALDN